MSQVSFIIVKRWNRATFNQPGSDSGRFKAKAGDKKDGREKYKRQNPSFTFLSIPSFQMLEAVTGHKFSY